MHLLMLVGVLLDGAHPVVKVLKPHRLDYVEAGRGTSMRIERPRDGA